MGRVRKPRLDKETAMGMGDAARIVLSPGDQQGGGGPSPRPLGAGNGAAGLEPEPPKPRIMHINQALAGGSGVGGDTHWKRKPNATGTGAVHVRSFHCKLAAESLELLDKQVNEWLDAHPEYEVKFVTSTIGEWQGKIREPNLIVQVWV